MENRLEKLNTIARHLICINGICQNLLNEQQLARMRAAQFAIDELIKEERHPHVAITLREGEEDGSVRIKVVFEPEIRKGKPLVPFQNAALDMLGAYTACGVRQKDGIEHLERPAKEC